MAMEHQDLVVLEVAGVQLVPAHRHRDGAEIALPDQPDELVVAVEDANVIGQNRRWRRGGLRRALYGQCQCSRVNDESSTMRAATIAGRRGKPIFSYPVRLRGGE